MSRSRGAKAVPLVRIGRYPPYTEGIYGAEQKDLRGCNRQLQILIASIGIWLNCIAESPIYQGIYGATLKQVDKKGNR